MEQSQNNGGAEECHSSESGWTMYIGSTVEEEDNDDVDNDDVDNDHNTQADPEDEGSDDSMASDASSGPSHYGNPLETIEGGYRGAEEKHDEKFFLEKKGNKSKGKQIAERKEEEIETVFIGDKGKAPDEDDDKGNNNYNMFKT